MRSQKGYDFKIRITLPFTLLFDKIELVTKVMKNKSFRFYD